MALTTTCNLVGALKHHYHGKLRSKGISRFSMKFGSLLLLAGLVVASSASAAPIYSWRDSSGATHFSDKNPPPGTQAQVWTAKGANFSVFKVAPSRSFRGKLFKNAYNSFIESAALTHGVASSLVKAVIHAESAFNPRAVSRKGARGLMQLMPGTANDMGVRNCFDPAQNIGGGARYLAFLLQRFDGNLKLAVAAYNAGPGAVEEFNGVPPYAETQSYVRRVLELKKRYDREA